MYKKSVIYYQNKSNPQTHDRATHSHTYTHTHAHTQIWCWTPSKHPNITPVLCHNVVISFSMSMISSLLFLTPHVLLYESAQTWCSSPPMWWTAVEITGSSCIWYSTSLQYLFQCGSSGSVIHIAWTHL